VSTVLVTGIAGTLGRLLVHRLRQDHRIVGVDRREVPGLRRNIRFYAMDIRRNRCESIFRSREIDAIVHLNILHDFTQDQHELHSFNVVGSQRLLDYAARYGVRKVVFLSTANVYGARADNPQYLKEEAPLLGGESYSEMRSLISADMLVSTFFWRMPDVETVVLRPTHIVGTVRNGPMAYLSLKTTPVAMGFDPMLQVIHENDVVEAIVAALRPGVRGLFNIAGSSAAPLCTLLRYLGKRPLPLPYPLLVTLAQRAWGTGRAHMPAAEIDFLRYSCLVDVSRASHELGFEPSMTLSETLESIRSLVATA
jgi:UDP-glucose 4-epimerase